MVTIRYRVELHHGGEIRVLGYMVNVRPHFRTLDPYHSQLTRDGKAGWLKLVDDETNEIVARRQIEPGSPSEDEGDRDSRSSREA